MNTQIKTKILENLNVCDKKNYPNICKKIQFEDGRELVCNMIYNVIVANPDFDIDNAMANVEYTLNEL